MRYWLAVLVVVVAGCWQEPVVLDAETDAYGKDGDSFVGPWTTYCPDPYDDSKCHPMTLSDYYDLYPDRVGKRVGI